MTSGSKLLIRRSPLNMGNHDKYSFQVCLLNQTQYHTISWEVKTGNHLQLMRVTLKQSYLNWWILWMQMLFPESKVSGVVFNTLIRIMFYNSLLSMYFNLKQNTLTTYRNCRQSMDECRKNKIEPRDKQNFMHTIF